MPPVERTGGAKRHLLRARPARAWESLKRRRAARAYRRLLDRLAGPRLLRAFARSYPEAVFVEVGANDGEHHDQLRPLILAHPWRGLMVEPVPYIFERLADNYGALGRITLVNAAVADRDGELPFFHPRDVSESEREQLPPWYDGIGSFSREAVLGHRDRIPDIEERLVERQVPCMTFASLCRRHSLERLDLLLIDTEGFDWEVLRQVDLDGLRPRLIVYEHFHLDAGTRAAAREHLLAHGYETLEEGFDTFALDPTPADELTAVWGRLRPAVAAVSAEEERG